MSSTIYSRFKLYSLSATHPLAVDIVRSNSQHGDLFSGQSTLIYVLFEETACSNVFPSNRHWNIGFIGTEVQFNAYSNYLAYLFDDGLARSSFIKNGAAWRSHQQTLMDSVEPLTPDAMESMDFVGCCFPYKLIKASEPLSAIMETPDLRYYIFCREPRCAITWGTVDNLQLMVAVSLYLTSKSGETRFTHTPWVLTRSRFRIEEWVSQATAESCLKSGKCCA